MRIAIVNDMPMTVELLRRIIAGISGCEVAWVAVNGLEAVEKCADNTPDMIIMDIIMPVMNGVEATRRIMTQSPCPILVVTASVDTNSSDVFDALGEGAIDAVNTPDSQGGKDERDFIRKIMIIKNLVIIDNYGIGKRKIHPTSAKTPTIPPHLVAIGASTGGPKALSDIFTEIPADINAAFIVIQHIDQRFAPGLASWLSSSCPLTVKIASTGDRPEKGKILLAGTNDHMILRSDGSVDYVTEPKHNPYRPSVNVFFSSLAEHWKHRGIAVLMTGIGHDGASGLLLLKNAGWLTFAQNRESCVVFGMPKAAIELNAAKEILSPQEIGCRIARMNFKELMSKP